MDKDRQMFIGTAGEFAEALEDWIIDNKCNPTTPEEWERCINDIVKKGSLAPLSEEDKAKYKDANVLRIHPEK